MAEEMIQEVKDKLLLIETLNQQIKDLIVKKGKIVNEINIPVYKAKEEAETILKEAHAQADQVTADIEQRKADLQEYIGKKKQEIQVIEDATKKGYEAFKPLQAEFNRKVEDFNASKYAFETNIQQQKREADIALGKAVELQNQQNKLKIALDSQQGNVNRQLQDLQSAMAKLEQLKSGTEKRIQDLKEIETSNASEKEEIIVLKAKNEEILAQIEAKQTENKNTLGAGERVLAEIKPIQEDTKNREQEIDNKLNRLAREHTRLDERTKSLNERERLIRLLGRQIDQKIAIIKKLRKEEEPK